MTKEEAKQRLLDLESEKSKLLEIINRPDHTPEEVFKEMLDGCVIYQDEQFPGSIFLMKGGKYMFEFEKQHLWCNYDLVWSVFYRLFGWDYNSTQLFIKGAVEEAFKCKGITPEPGYVDSGYAVEEAFNKTNKKQ